MRTVQVEVSVDDDGSVTLTLPPGSLPLTEIVQALVGLTGQEASPEKKPARMSQRRRSPRRAAAAAPSPGATQEQALAVLREEGETTPGKLAEKLGVSRPTVRKVLRSLCEAGSVEVEGSTTNRVCRAL